MTKNKPRLAETTARGASFEEALTAVTGQPSLVERDMTEVALNALFGARLERGDDKPSPPLADPPRSVDAPTSATWAALDDARPETSETPANDDADRAPFPETRLDRRIAIVVTILVLAVASVVVALRLDLGGHASLVQIGAVVAGVIVVIAVIALGAYLHGLGASRRPLGGNQAAHWNRLTALLSALDDAARARAEGERSRADAVAADLTILRERIERIAASYGPAAHRSAEIEAFAARIVALERKVGEGFQAIGSDLRHVRADLEGALAERRPPFDAAPEDPVPEVSAPQVPAPEVSAPKISAPRISAPERPAPDDAADKLAFDLFCDGLMATILGDAGGTLRPARDAAGAVLDRMFDGDRLLDAWDRYRHDGIADFAAVYRAGGLGVMERLRARLTTDPTSSARAGDYMARYEALIMAASQSDRTAELMAMLSDTKGRCYTLLAHAAGRLRSHAPAEPAIPSRR